MAQQLTKAFFPHVKPTLKSFLFSQYKRSRGVKFLPMPTLFFSLIFSRVVVMNRNHHFAFHSKRCMPIGVIDWLISSNGRRSWIIMDKHTRMFWHPEQRLQVISILLLFFIRRKFFSGNELNQQKS